MPYLLVIMHNAMFVNYGIIIIISLHVCLMSQSWDNVANMYELFTVSSHTQKIYHACPLLVQCACSSTNFEPIKPITSDHTP